MITNYELGITSYELLVTNYGFDDCVNLLPLAIRAAIKFSIRVAIKSLINSRSDQILNS